MLLANKIYMYRLVQSLYELIWPLQCHTHYIQKIIEAQVVIKILSVWGYFFPTMKLQKGYVDWKMSIDKRVSSEWVKFQSWMNYSFNISENCC